MPEELANTTLKPSLSPEQLEQLHAVHGLAHSARGIVFALLYLGVAALIVTLAEDGLTPRELAACLPLWLVAAASLHGLSLFTHEGVHGTLAENAGLNRLLAMICAWPVLQTFSAYKVLHLRHHKFLGREGDPDHYHNYTDWPWLVFLMHWGRLLIGYPVYVTMIPILGFRQGRNSDRAWILFEVLMVAAGLSAAIVWLPWTTIWSAWLLPMAMINSMVNIRGMSQHTLLPDPSHELQGSRTILTNPITQFFMCNENFHLEHHLYPRVPWYNLPKLHAALRPELEERRAPFIPSYLAFVREFIAETYRRSPLGRHRAARS